jgi:hypothetical protein
LNLATDRAVAASEIRGHTLNRELREFRRLERACRESAAATSLELEREGLLKVAEDYRKAIEALRTRAGGGETTTKFER